MVCTHYRAGIYIVMQHYNLCRDTYLQDAFSQVFFGINIGGLFIYHRFGFAEFRYMGDGCVKVVG
jgi:hypothetical protein